MNRKFQGIWVPKEIWLHPTLSIQAKLLWAEIQSLHCDDRGGCYADNDYLCGFMGVKLRRLQEIIKELKKSGLVEQVSFNGRERILRALTPQSDCMADVQETASGGFRRAGSCTPSMQDPASSPIYRDTNRDTINKRGGRPPKPPAHLNASSSKKIKRAEHVSTTDEEHEKLVKEYGEKKIQNSYERLSEWKLDTPRSKWKKSDYRSIRRWVVAAVEEASGRPPKMNPYQKDRRNTNNPPGQDELYDGLF